MTNKTSEHCNETTEVFSHMLEKRSQELFSSLVAFSDVRLSSRTLTLRRMLHPLQRALTIMVLNSGTNWLIFGSFPIKKKECVCTERFDNLASELA
jgi:hypothetical protein